MSIASIIVIGDIMLDHYIYGEASRISPEAPVPIVKKNRESFQLGGAANVSVNLSKLGVDCLLIGGIGQDRSGKAIRDILQNESIDHSLIQLSTATTQKTRIIANRFQVVRIDEEEQSVLSKEDIESIVDQIKEHKPKLVLLSDYDKGICSAELCQNVIKASRKVGSKVLVDPKKADWEKFSGSYLLKPNRSEWDVWATTKGKHDDMEQEAQRILSENEVENVLITLGSEGMRLFQNSGENHSIEAHRVDVFDVSGAGDTVLSVIAHGLLQGKNLLDAITIANKAASYVITKSNTYPISLEELNALKDG